MIAASLVPAGIILLGLTSSFVFTIPNQPAVLLALVVFSGLLGGPWVGVFAAALQVLFSLWFVNGVEVAQGAAPFIQWGEGQFFALSLSEGEFQRVVVFLVVSSAVAVATGWFRWRYVLLADRAEELESFAQNVFQKAAVGIAYADLTGTILSCNVAFASMVGRRIRDIEGRHFETLIYPADLASNTEAVKDLFAGKVSSVTLVGRYARPDGSPVWVRKIVNLIFSTDGKPRNIMVFSREIAAELAKDAKLAAEELRYRTLWEGSPQANLSILTPDLKIDDANEAALALFEASSKADLQSFGLFALSSNRQLDSDSTRQELQSHLRELWSKGCVRFEWLFRTLSGREICCMVSMTRLSSEGQEGAQVMLRDITDSVALKKLQREQNALLASELRERTAEIEDLLYELHLAQNIAKMGSFSINLLTGRCSCSPALARLFEFEVYDDYELDVWRSKIHEDDRQLVRDAWDDALAGAPYDLIYRIRVSTGIRYIHATARFTRNSSGQAVSAMGTDVDVTPLMPEGFVPHEKRLKAHERHSSPLQPEAVE